MAYVAIDCDGTITTRTDYPTIGELRPGCEKVLRRLVEAGHVLLLWSCREGPDLLAAINWLADHGLMFLFTDYNAHPQELLDLYPGRNPRKLGADVFIDDRNLAWIGAEFDWGVIEAELEDAGLLPRENQDLWDRARRLSEQIEDRGVNLPRDLAENHDKYFHNADL